jgi:hypothetical protein
MLCGGGGGRICLAGGSVPLTATGGGADLYTPERESLRIVAAGTLPTTPNTGCRLT